MTLFLAFLSGLVCATAHGLFTEETVDSKLIRPCTKLLNSTASVGCDGPLRPKAGILLANLSYDQIAYISEHQTYYPFIPVLNARRPNLTQTLLKLSETSGTIVGVIIIGDKSGVTFPLDDHPRSDDVSCPNGKIAHPKNATSCYGWINWQDRFLGAFFRHWQFPIFYLEDANLTNFILNCSSRWNGGIFLGTGSSLKFNEALHVGLYCAAELYYPTYAPSVGEARCLQQVDRRITFDKVTFCNKIRPHNILVPLMPMFYRNMFYQNRSVFILATRLDSLTLFPGKSPAADSVFTALIVLFSIVHTLAKNRAHFEDTKRQVIFAFYGGESLGNIGSSYHAYVLNLKRSQKKNKLKPHDKGTWELSGITDLNLDQVGYLLELNQLAPKGLNSSVWLHIQPRSGAPSKSGWSLSSELLRNAKAVSGVSLKESGPGVPIPPSSVHSFNLFSATHLEAVVLSNHESTFTNPYYHSLFDVGDLLPLRHTNSSALPSPLAHHLSAISTVVSQTLANFLMHKVPQKSQKMVADVNVTQQLIGCIFLNQSCPFSHSSQRTDRFNESNFDATDVLTSSLSVVHLVVDIMSNFTGKRMPCSVVHSSASGNKEQLLAYHYVGIGSSSGNISNAVCLRSQVFYRRVISPYFLSHSSERVKPFLSQWVVSHHGPSWASPRLRLFVLATKTSDLLFLTTGLTTILFAVLILVKFGGDSFSQ